MRLLPSGTAALLLEVEDLEEVLALYAALSEDPPAGVVDLVPAARTVLVVIDPARTSLTALEAALRRVRPVPVSRDRGELLEVPVIYDGEDLVAAAELLGWDEDELVRRHTDAEWTVAFCGFAPGFAYLTSAPWRFDVPRRATPRVRVPAGSVALAAEFSGVYPRESPGGWQLIGRTKLEVFDVARRPAALLRPGVRVRFRSVLP